MKRTTYAAAFLLAASVAALFLLPPPQRVAAQKKISDFTEETTPASTDLIEISKDLGGGNYTTRKAQLSNVSKGLNLSNATTGTLPIARGGTGATSFTSGRIPRIDGAAFVDSPLSTDGTNVGIGGAGLLNLFQVYRDGSAGTGGGISVITGGTATTGNEAFINVGDSTSTKRFYMAYQRDGSGVGELRLTTGAKMEVYATGGVDLVDGGLEVNNDLVVNGRYEDADGDTYFDLEQSADDDTVRIGVAGTEVGRFDTDATAGNTRFMLYDVDNGTLERVSVGAADSGGSGYKVLRIPN